MKKLFTLLVLTALISLFSYEGYAQQDAHYTQYLFNKMQLNPAYAGTLNGLSLTGIYRLQWIQIDDAPRSISLNGHSPIGNRVGVGLHLENDRVGVHDRWSMFASYAYRIPVGGEGNLSLGLQAGFLHYASNWSELSNDIQNVSNDPSFNNGVNASKLLPNFGLGAYYYTNSFWLGISVPHLLNSSLDNVDKNALYNNHYFFNTGVLFSVSDALKIRPSLLLKSVPALAPLSLDANLSFIIRDALWLGATYRFGDALAFLLEYQFVNGLRLGYAYDLTTSRLRVHNTGTHEIMLGWDIGGTGGSSNGEKILSPRFF